MSFHELEQLFAELAAAGVLFLELSGGEASLRPDLPDLLRVARRHHFAISLLTNAYSLSEVLVSTLVEVGVQIVFVSVYSDVPAEHDAVTRVPGSFERTTANIRRLRALGIRVQLGMPFTSASSATRERLDRFALDLGCEAVYSADINAREDGTTKPQQVAASPDQLRAFFAAAQASPAEAREAKLDKSPCGVCAQSVTILSNGSIQPCTAIQHELGHARDDDSFRAIASSADFQLLAGIRWRDLHGCRDCDLVPWCSRCHGSAFHEGGDLFGPQPEACRVAIAHYEGRVRTLRRLPRAEGGDDRSPEIGPFALVGEDAVRPEPDRLTAADLAIRASFPWVVRSAPAIVPAHRLVRRKPAPVSSTSGSMLDCIEET
jgi:radical SAM protein with 4Fe4S-binding SPASM domain